MILFPRRKAYLALKEENESLKKTNKDLQDKVVELTKSLDELTDKSNLEICRLTSLVFDLKPKRDSKGRFVKKS